MRLFRIGQDSAPFVVVAVAGGIGSAITFP
jgi:hypothetical protein